MLFRVVWRPVGGWPVEHTAGLSRAPRALKLAVHLLIGVVGGSVVRIRVQRLRDRPRHRVLTRPKNTIVQFGHVPQRHGDGVAPLQLQAMVDVKRQDPPMGYLGEVRGVPSWGGSLWRGLG